MPIINGKYKNPNWVNDAPPAIDAEELNAMSESIETVQGSIITISDNGEIMQNGVNISTQIASAVGGAFDRQIDCSAMTEPLIIFDSGTINPLFAYTYKGGVLGLQKLETCKRFELTNNRIYLENFDGHSALGGAEFHPVQLKNITANTKFLVEYTLTTSKDASSFSCLIASSMIPRLATHEGAGVDGIAEIRKEWASNTMPLSTELQTHELSLSDFEGLSIEVALVIAQLRTYNSSTTTQRLTVSKVILEA